MQRTTYWTLLPSLLLALALSACGGEEPTSTPVPAPTATPTVAEVATPTTAPTEAIAATPPLTTTEMITGPAEVTATEEMTSAATISGTEAMTATEKMTTTEALSDTEAVATPDFAGLYLASLPAASSPGRAITLTLSADGAVSMTTDYLNNEPPIVEVGTWASNDNGTATVTLTGQADRAYDTAVVIIFALEGNTLTATEYDQSLYGSEGLTLEKQPETGTMESELVGKWQLVKISYSNDNEVTPDDPTHYTLEFLPGGRLAVQNDCNRGMGSYTVEGSRLTLGPIAFTRALCPPGSLYDEMAKNLEMVASYVLADGLLNLALAMDGGVLEFEPVR